MEIPFNGIFEEKNNQTRLHIRAFNSFDIQIFSLKNIVSNRLVHFFFCLLFEESNERTIDCKRCCDVSFYDSPCTTCEGFYRGKRHTRISAWRWCTRIFDVSTAICEPRTLSHNRRTRNFSLEYPNCQLDGVVAVVVAAVVVAANHSFEQLGSPARGCRHSCNSTTTLKQQHQIG